MELEWIDFGKLLAAVAAGALVGLERELQDKPAGFRTNIMICLGAALFTLLSVRLAEVSAVADRSRIAAQIVTGVGFLGAGAIIQHRSNVVGLTTAATIWVVASLGMAFGAGAFLLGTVGTVLASAVLFALGFAETRIFLWRSAVTFEVELDPAEDADEVVERLTREAGVRCRSWTVQKTAETTIGRLTAVGPGLRLEQLQRALSREKAIRVLKRL